MQHYCLELLLCGAAGGDQSCRPPQLDGFIPYNTIESRGVLINTCVQKRFLFLKNNSDKVDCIILSSVMSLKDGE